MIADENAILVKETFEIVSLELYPIDNIWKTLSKKGLNIGRSAFYDLWRNPTYMGFTKVPKFGDEEEYYVQGLDEALVSEDLFHSVRSVLKKIGEKSCIPLAKSKQREKYPLRWFLVCPSCNQHLTGSSSRN